MINILKRHKFKKFNYLKHHIQKKPTTFKYEDHTEETKQLYPSAVKIKATSRKLSRVNINNHQTLQLLCFQPKHNHKNKKYNHHKQTHLLTTRKQTILIQ